MQENNSEILKYPNGRPQQVKVFNPDDSITTVLEYYDSGYLKGISKFKDSLPIETSYTFKETGKILTKKEWWPNGKIKTQLAFPKKYPRFSIYNEDGSVNEELENEWSYKNNSVAEGITIKDTFNIGNEYINKLFLRNSHIIYTNPNLVPTMKILPYRASYEELKIKGQIIPMSNDTGIVKFIIHDNPNISKGINKSYWSGLITVHLPESDTSFVLIQEYLIKK